MGIHRSPPLASTLRPLPSQPPPIQPDPVWMIRGAAAYEGLNRTDPDAQWSFQGWAIIDWGTPGEASPLSCRLLLFLQTRPLSWIFCSRGQLFPRLRRRRARGQVRRRGHVRRWLGRVAEVERCELLRRPVRLDVAPRLWRHRRHEGAALRELAGAVQPELLIFRRLLLQGNLERANLIPFSGLPPASNTTVIGTGYTPEGLFTDPVYYDFLMGGASVLLGARICSPCTVSRLSQRTSALPRSPTSPATSSSVRTAATASRRLTLL